MLSYFNHMDALANNSVCSERHIFDEILRKIPEATIRVVVAQLVEWLLPIPEVRGWNPVVGKILFTSTVY